ncbi:hypothetical protein [Streptomyces adustus]|uniref:hypothetical protein n=1 Tax=Streptomyces adustus TaxID=1609272 RepID=UPI00128E4EFB|nr:hypothetical protein [Streptomyces adustus]
MLLTDDLADLRTAVVEPDRFGGTCLNRGCVPSKMFVVAADVAETARSGARLASCRPGKVPAAATLN